MSGTSEVPQLAAPLCATRKSAEVSHERSLPADRLGSVATCSCIRLRLGERCMYSAAKDAAVTVRRRQPSAVRPDLPQTPRVGVSTYMNADRKSCKVPVKESAMSPVRTRPVFEDIKSVPWAQLSHAYGVATDVPVWLRRLQKPRSALQALGDLYAAVLHQGSLYSATPLAVHFIARLAAETATPERAALIFFLRSFGASVEAGMAGHADDLPETLSPAEFEAQCQAALREAGQMLLPGLEDAGADVRSATIYLIESFDPPLPQAVERLRQCWPARTMPR
jgi:hypothetical protein